jgi:hypothetical protein
VLFCYHFDTTEEMWCIFWVVSREALLEMKGSIMVVWYPCTHEEFLSTQEEIYKNGNAALLLLSHDHLGDEEEPMDLFIWGYAANRSPVLRSAVTVNKELYWRV